MGIEAIGLALLGGAASAVLGNVLSPSQSQSSATPAPTVTPPTPMPLDTKTTQKTDQQKQQMAMAGSMTPQATLLGGDKKNTLG